MSSKPQSIKLSFGCKTDCLKSTRNGVRVGEDLVSVLIRSDGLYGTAPGLSETFGLVEDVPPSLL